MKKKLSNFVDIFDFASILSLFKKYRSKLLTINPVMRREL